MDRTLGLWVTPFTTLQSIYDAIGIARTLATSISSANRVWTPRLIVPAHYGVWPQSQCKQTLPPDMLTSSPADIARMRWLVNSKGVRFGAWGVPLSLDSAPVAASYATAAGWFSVNFEPTAAFWIPGDDPSAIDQWWGGFWNGLPDQSKLDGRVQATVVPNAWGLSAFENSLPNLAAGCNALSLEVYGGERTASQYGYPNLWPTEGFTETRATGVQATLVPILARANLHAQIAEAAGLSNGNGVQVWAI